MISRRRDSTIQSSSTRTILGGPGTPSHMSGGGLGHVLSGVFAMSPFRDKVEQPDDRMLSLPVRIVRAALSPFRSRRSLGPHDNRIAQSWVGWSELVHTRRKIQQGEDER